VGRRRTHGKGGPVPPLHRSRVRSRLHRGGQPPSRAGEGGQLHQGPDGDPPQEDQLEPLLEEGEGPAPGRAQRAVLVAVLHQGKARLRRRKGQQALVAPLPGHRAQKPGLPGTVGRRRRGRRGKRPRRVHQHVSLDVRTRRRPETTG